VRHVSVVRDAAADHNRGNAMIRVDESPARLAVSAAVVVAAALLFAACERRPDDAPLPGAAAEREPLEPTHEYLFVRVTDTVAVERAGMTADVVEGEMRELDTQQRLSYRADAGGAAFRRIELTVFDPAQPDQARVRGLVDVRGDSVFSEQHENGAVRRESRGVPPGTELYLNPSMAQLEHILLRAELRTGEGIEMSVLSLSAAEPPRLGTPLLTRITADTVDVVIDGESTARLHVDAMGRIIGGRAAGGLTLHRRELR
jgi:hypothetical protein